MNNTKVNTRVCSYCPLNEQVIGKKVVRLLLCIIVTVHSSCTMNTLMKADA